MDSETLDDLLAECRTFCGITWKDDQADKQLTSFIKSSDSRLKSIYGGDLSYDVEDEENPDVNALARDLLIHRVFYMREKGLDDFEDNFRAELNTLYRKGQVAQYLKKQKETESNSDA